MASPHVAGVVARYLRRTRARRRPRSAPRSPARPATWSRTRARTRPISSLFAGLGVGTPTALPSSCGGEYTPVTPAPDPRHEGRPVRCRATSPSERSERRVVRRAGRGLWAHPVHRCGGGRDERHRRRADLFELPHRVAVGRHQARRLQSQLRGGPDRPRPRDGEARSPPGTSASYNLTGSTQVIFDVVGWYGAPGGTPGGRFHPEQPDRVLDTRGDLNVTCNPSGGALGPTVTRTRAGQRLRLGAGQVRDCRRSECHLHAADGERLPERVPGRPRVGVDVEPQLRAGCERAEPGDRAAVTGGHDQGVQLRGLHARDRRRRRVVRHRSHDRCRSLQRARTGTGARHVRDPHHSAPARSRCSPSRALAVCRPVARAPWS